MNRGQFRDAASQRTVMAKIDELAAMMKACGHPLRLKILCAIQLGEETCVSELWNCLDQSQPVVSQHLAVLKRRGIVSSEVQGNKRVYKVTDPFIRSIVSSLADSADEIKEKLRTIKQARP
jgi:ArsR family transcriptional regulator, arsenate/arsenite/antimonite-responsive transcriptional repressor